MTTKLLIVILIALWPNLPWTSEAKTMLKDSRAEVIFAGEPLDGRGVCCGPKPSFSISSTCARDALPMVVLHESQHLLPALYNPRLPNGDYDFFGHFDRWGGFNRVAIACAKERRSDRMVTVLKFARMSALGLHAQLPYLLKGDLCPKLQPWYPWFDLTLANQVKVKGAG